MEVNLANILYGCAFGFVALAIMYMVKSDKYNKEGDIYNKYVSRAVTSALFCGGVWALLLGLYLASDGELPSFFKLFGALFTTGSAITIPYDLFRAKEVRPRKEP